MSLVDEIQRGNVGAAISIMNSGTLKMRLQQAMQAQDKIVKLAAHSAPFCSLLP